MSFLPTKLVYIGFQASNLEGKVQRSQACCIQAKEKLLHIEVRHQQGEVQALAKGLALQQRFAIKVKGKLEILQTAVVGHNNPQV